MARKKHIALRLAPTQSSKQDQSKKDLLLADFATNLLAHSKTGEAMMIAGEHAGMVFDRQYSEEITRLEQKLVEYDARYAASFTQLTRLEARVHDTPETKKGAPESILNKDGGISLSDWRWRDLFGATLAFGMSMAAMVLGWSNVYSNLMSSGNSTFIEQPWIAGSLAMLLPIGATALKFIANFISADAWRRRYTLFNFIVLLILLILWGVLFGMTFNGAAGGVNWDTLGKPDSIATSLVYVQLLCEMFGAAALYLAFEDIASRYSPDSTADNSEFHAATKARDRHLKDHEALSDIRSAAHGRLASLRALREETVDEAVAHHLALRKANHPTFGH